MESVTRAFVDGFSNVSTSEDTDLLRQAAEQIVLCVSQDSVHTLLDTITSMMSESRDHKVKQSCALMITCFVSRTNCSFDSHVPMLLQAILKLYIEPEEELVLTGQQALAALLKAVPEEKYTKHIAFVRGVVADITITNRVLDEKRATIPGFCLKKGLEPLLPMFQHGLMHGTPQVRVDSADGLGELVSLTTEQALAPFVIKMTGPLIRIVGDRVPPEVKAAILKTLGLLIIKVGKYLKPFLPQLQTTFIKALSDPTAVVRTRGGIALADLMTESKRVEPVVQELLTNIKSDIAPPLKTSMFTAIVGILLNKEVGPKLANDCILKARDAALEFLSHEKDSVRRESARCLAVAAQYDSDENILNIISNVLLKVSPAAEWREKDGYLQALTGLSRTSQARIPPALRDSIHKLLLTLLKDEHPAVKSSSILAIGEYLNYVASQPTATSYPSQNDVVLELLNSLAPLVSDDSSTVRQEACVRIQHFAELATAEMILLSLDILVPALLSRSTDTIGPVRHASQGAFYFLLQYHKGQDRGDKVVNAYSTRLNKKDPSAATALVTYVRKSVAGRKTPKVNDEWDLSTAAKIEDDSSSSSSSSSSSFDEDAE